MMSFIPYNSRDLFFKDRFGSVSAGEKIHFRLCMPRSFCCNRAILLIRRDDGHYEERDMLWAGMCGDDAEIWDIHTDIEKEGLYWYHFDYCSSYGRSSVLQTENGVGGFAGSHFARKDWQLTVTEKDFTTPDWIKGGIIYQIFPDRFYNSGEKKKNVPTDRVLRSDWGNEPEWRPTAEGKVLNNDFFGGDLKGIQEKLPYLKSMGVNCIYLNPIFEAHSNHRYDTADYGKIDPVLGTEKDFKNLCESAKKQGIHIILDGVFSHTGDDSVYFNKKGRYETLGAYNSPESPYYKWYKFTNYPDKYQSWWGFETLPEVIEEGEEYREFINGKGGIIEKWLKAGADGFRLDVADELPDIFIDELRERLKKTKPDALLMGEVWEDATTKHSYGSRRRYLLGSQFDSVMNYPFANAILDFCRNGKAERFMETIMQIVENYPKQCLDVMMNHIGTHDTERAITKISGESCEYRDRVWQSQHFLDAEKYAKGVRLLKCAAALQYTLPGVPSVYYGDEAGLQGYKDPFNRGCYPWGKENQELVTFYRTLGEIRTENEVFREGYFSPVSGMLGCVAYRRHNETGDIMVIVNRNEHSITYGLPENYKNAKTLYGENVKNGEVFIDECSFVILSL
ncbi:MAG: glycoside hydrolase family 13 protein [Clostridia bacterium]|nr:glycoside hydrolase family 13 protein [Clostridia bacterium]